MSLIHKPKGSNFASPLARLSKLDQKTANTLPNPPSITPNSHKFADGKKENHQADPKQHPSAFPSR
jgi:hypothetical protein